MNSQDSQESPLISEQSFKEQIFKIRETLLKDIAPIYDEICGYAESETGLSEPDIDFSSLIEKLNRKLDIHLPGILPILEQYKKVDSISTGTDFPHIWYGFGKALSGILFCYREQIHEIVDPISHQLSFGKGFPNKWRKLAEQIKGRIERTNNLQ